MEFAHDLTSRLLNKDESFTMYRILVGTVDDSVRRQS